MLSPIAIVMARRGGGIDCRILSGYSLFLHLLKSKRRDVWWTPNRTMH